MYGGGGLLAWVRAVYQWLQHWVVWFFFSQQTLIVSSSSGRWGSSEALLHRWWNVDWPSLVKRTRNCWMLSLKWDRYITYQTLRKHQGRRDGKNVKARNGRLLLIKALFWQDTALAPMGSAFSKVFLLLIFQEQDILQGFFLWLLTFPIFQPHLSSPHWCMPMFLNWIF